MTLENTRFRVKIEIEETYTVGSADNRLRCDVIHNPLGFSRGSMVKAYDIHVRSAEGERETIVVGSSYYIPNFLLVDDLLAMTIVDKLVILRLEDCEIVQVIEFEPNYLLDIFPWLDGYILWGELDVVKLDAAFAPVWSFSARDMLVDVNVPVGESLILQDDRIIVRDFLEYRYEVDRNGKLIAEYAPDKTSREL